MVYVIGPYGMGVLRGSIKAYWRLMTSWAWVIIDLCIGFSAGRTNTLPKPILTCQLDPRNILSKTKILVFD